MNERTAQRDWFTIFRTSQDVKWRSEEVKKGRLRQGWGAEGLSLRTEQGQVDKES